MPRNKAHKQRFGSKHALANKSKGRCMASVRQGPQTTGTGNMKHSARQKANALRLKRSQAARAQRRMGSITGIPRVVGFIPANESGNTGSIVQEVCHALHVDYLSLEAPFTVVSKKEKACFTFIYEQNCNDQECIDIVKVSDIVVIVLDISQMTQDMIKELHEPNLDVAEDETQTVATTWFSDIGLCITDYTRDLVASMNSQGAPSIVVALQNLHTLPEKQRRKVFKVHQRYFFSVLHESTMVLAVDTAEDYTTLVRHLQVTKLRQLKWREQHPYFVVEGGEYKSDSRQLTLCGHLRGKPLAATQLIHLTNHGTFQISSISIHNVCNETILLEESCVEQRESLESLQANSTLEDGGLPTAEDVAYANKMEKAHQLKVPPGASEYQAAWYDTEENAVCEADAPRSPVTDDDVDAFADIESFHTTQTDVDFLKVKDVIRLERMTDEEREAEMQRLRESSEEEGWNPDVVESSVKVPARQRFVKYRGLKSFHTGKWDPAENLPPQFAYIYKLRGYARIRESAIAKCAQGAAEVGQCVSVTLENVPASVWGKKGGSLLIASGQLEHEQKWSVLHFHVQRSSDFDEPIKSKTPMLAHIGFRKFYVSPLFSDITSGDRTKFLRFFHSCNTFCMASFYGPITYAPCPILLFQVPSLEEQSEGNPLRLACFGGAVPPNPDLLILKRAVLTGRVAVIYKKNIVVKCMFFNDEDVKWFQPVDLYTKLGRRGRILKPVGTHGLFKAILNDQVMQHDVVCMDLYKRVFPKWNTVEFNIAEVPAFSGGDNEEEG